MQIKEAIIGQFGKLQNRQISFEPGINVIYGENEAGKTTLHDFLLAMFFGMEKGRGRNTLNSIYKKHEPWHAPSYYSGALRFLVDEKPFYLERNFYYKDKKDILKNEADGEELSVVYGDLSMLLGGIDKETFGNTYDIPQTGAVTGKELADILSEYLSNAAEGGGANIQVQKAKAALTARKKELAQEVRIIHEQKNEDIRQFIVEKDLLERDARGLHANIADAEREINQLKRVRVEEIGEKRKRLSEQKRQQADRRERQENAPHKREIDGAMQPEKEHPDRMAGIGICASALLVNIAVMADPDEKTALVVVPDYQLSLAIGKEGQNARLAARLTGFKIDIKSETQAKEAGDFYDYDDDETAEDAAEASAEETSAEDSLTEETEAEEVSEEVPVEEEPQAQEAGENEDEE